MTVTQWNTNVNTKFYEFTEGYEDNAITTEYTSGRKVRTLKNTRFVKNFECKLSLNVTNGEYATFQSWYEGMGGTAGTFTCTALGAGYYRFKEVPEFSAGQQWREVKFTIEEVY